MTVFKRKITYFYEHHKENIGSTAGFLKLEIRGDKVKIIINIQEPMGFLYPNAGLYFYHQTGDHLTGVKVGNVERINGMLTYQERTDWQNLYGLGRDLYTFDGVAVVYQQDHYYIGDFQDKSRKEFKLILKEGKTEEERTKEKEHEKSGIHYRTTLNKAEKEGEDHKWMTNFIQDYMQKDRKYEENKEEGVLHKENHLFVNKHEEAGNNLWTEREHLEEKNFEVKKETAGENNLEMEKGTAEESNLGMWKETAGENNLKMQKVVTKENNREMEKETAEESNFGMWKETAGENNLKMQEVATKENSLRMEKETAEENNHGMQRRFVEEHRLVEENGDMNMDAAMLQKERFSGYAQSSNQEKNADVYDKCKNCPYQKKRMEQQETKSVLEKMLLEYPKLPIYGATELFDCVRIHPRDIGKLDMRNWKLGVNSFLTHGFYTYQYLLLGKMQFDSGSAHPILGVPGVFSNRDRYLANMFGFEQFIPVKRTGTKTGQFGYWIVEIQ